MAARLQPAQAGAPPARRVPIAAREALGYLAAAAAFPLATFFLPPLLVLRSGADHALLDLATALTACFCSLQAFVRYQSRPQPMFLWLGAGFLASGMFDGLHAMVSLQGTADPGNLGSRSWAASSVLLGIYLMTGLARYREPATPRGARSQETLVWGITVGALSLLVPALTLLPASQVVWQAPLHRPYELLPAAIMAFALWRAWRTPVELDPAFRQRLGMALVLYVALHAGVMAWSTLPLDEFVAMSHLAKFVAHWLVAVGLLQSSANLLTEAEHVGHKLAGQATKLVEQEHKIQQTLTLTSMILDHTTVAIYSTDRAGIITRFNQAAQKWLGYTEQEAVGRLTPAAFHDRGELRRYADVLARQHGLPATSGVDTLLAMPRRGYPDHREWMLVRKGGSQFPASVSIVPLEDEDGAIHGFVLVVNDLSHQKEVELIKNEFVSTVSHELRTPLTSIRGSLGLLTGGVAGPLPGPAKSLLDIAQRNAERLILLVNDILDIEKIEAGKMRFAIKAVELDAAIAEAVTQAEGFAGTRRIRLVRRGAAPGLRVRADEQRLAQVLANLLSNAIKFSPEGGSVEIDAGADAGQGQVRITDHGPGIPEASQARIFQKFFQADSSSAREKGGTGLGLSICKALVERMDGRIGFRSQPGETVFEFALPAERAGAGAPAAAAGGEAPLLVVEDDYAMGELMRRLLEDLVPVAIARTLGQAREHIARERIAGVVLDLGLPDGDGAGLIPVLRDAQPGVPILVFSELPLSPADAARVAAVLSKSGTSLEDLVAAVKRMIEHPEHPHAQDAPATHLAG